MRNSFADDLERVRIWLTICQYRRGVLNRRREMEEGGLQLPSCRCSSMASLAFLMFISAVLTSDEAASKV